LIEDFKKTYILITAKSANLYLLYRYFVKMGVNG